MIAVVYLSYKRSDDYNCNKYGENETTLSNWIAYIFKALIAGITKY